MAASISQMVFRRLVLAVLLVTTLALFTQGAVAQA